MTLPLTETATYTLAVPGALLTYDVRRNDSSDTPVLLLIGSPMGAAGFVTLASHFTDRTVVTYDPRGVERSRRTDSATTSTPTEHADDLHRLIKQLDSGPVDIFASSGGAVNALAFAAAHPEQVHTLVAHEPPLIQVLPDREVALQASVDISETYQQSGFGPAMAKFIALVMHKGELPADYARQPDPDPAVFGLPTEDDGSRNDPLLGQNIVTGTHYQLDLSTLRTAPVRILIGVGAESEGELAHRAALALAEQLETEPVIFPSNHGGFLGGEYGQTGDPDAFAATLRKVLASGK